MSAAGDTVGELLDLGLCCPRCHGGLDGSAPGGEGALRCRNCQSEYPVILGIPDLRVAPDPYIGLDDDRAKGRRLRAEGGPTWESMAAFYYEITDSVPPAQAAQFTAGLRSAVARADAALATWQAMAGGNLAASRLLEIGCGTAPLLAAPGAPGAVKIGVDVAFRWLVVGQQRLRDAGARAHLVCACAEALPFATPSFDLVVAQGTLENVRDPAQAVAEAGRVMVPGGKLLVATANRWSPAPDPHLGMPGGGLLPDAIVAGWARRRGALPPQRHLFSAPGLAALLRTAGFTAQRYAVPAVGAAQRSGLGAFMRLAAAGYELVRSIPLLRQVLLAIGPTLMAVAEQPGTRSAAPNR